jgi:hypothetical protein
MQRTKALATVLATLALGASAGCKPSQQEPGAEGPPIQPTHSSHLAHYVSDTSRSLDGTVLGELAHELAADSGVAREQAIDSTRMVAVEMLRAALGRLDERFAKRLIPRLQSDSFDTSLEQPDFDVWNHEVSRASATWDRNDEQQLLELVGQQLTYRALLTVRLHRPNNVIDDGTFESGRFFYLAKVTDMTLSHVGYPPLDIDPNVRAYCVYLSKDNAFLKKASTGCLEQYATVPTGLHRFDVVRRSVKNRKVPKVTRWEWNAAKSTHTIGVRCGTDWCSIVPHGSQPGDAEDEDAADGDTDDDDDYRVVPGWGDFQPLGELSGTTMVPTGPLARIRPTKHLDDFNNSAAGTLRRFVNLATIRLMAAPAANGKYDRMGLKMGKNKVAVCRGTKAECAASEGGTPNLKNCASGQLHARITQPSSDTPVYHCVDYVGDQAATAVFPNVVRWSWEPLDELFWIRCPQGCCQLKF